MQLSITDLVTGERHERDIDIRVFVQAAKDELIDLGMSIDELDITDKGKHYLKARGVTQLDVWHLLSTLTSS